MCWLARAKNSRTVLGTGEPQGFEQPFNHGAQELIGLQVHRWLHQSWVTTVQKVGAEHLESMDRAVQERSDDRFGGRRPRPALRGSAAPPLWSVLHS